MSDSSTSTGSSSAGIERDLDETRSRLGAHINELQDRLSPGQVLDDLMGYFRGSEGAVFGENLMGNIRQNPMPAAVTAIGLAWLMASNPRGGSASTAGTSADRHHYGRDDHVATVRRIEEAEHGVQRTSGEAEHAYSARLDEARGRAMGLAQHAQETTESFRSRVSDAIDSAKRAVAGTAHDARDQASGAAASVKSSLGAIGSSARDAAASAGDRAGHPFSQTGRSAGAMASDSMSGLTESPVLLGALGLAAGALLGALIPRSEQEDAALGGVARQARDAAGQLAAQGRESGRHVADAVAGKARESAEAHGLGGGKTAGELADDALSGKLAEGASQVAKDALRTGHEAVRDEMDRSDGSSARPDDALR